MPVFDAGSLDGKAVREQYKVLLKWIRDKNNSAMYRSGTDDEDAPNELIQLLTETSELYLKWEERKESASQKKNDERKRNECKDFIQNHNYDCDIIFVLLCQSLHT